MLWLILIPAAAACLLTPVTCTLRAAWQSGWHVTLFWQAGPLRFRQQRLLPRSQPRRTAKPDISRLALISDLYRSGHLHRLRGHIRLHQLTVRAALFLPDAARTAQLCGLLNTLPALLPRNWATRTHVSVTPDFWSGRQQAAAECIFSLRLGMLMADAARLLIAIGRQRRRPPKEGKDLWNSTPSAT